MSTKSNAAWLVFLTLLLVPAAPAEAQIGGIAKKARQKVSEAVTGQPQPQAATQEEASTSPYGESVLEMTPAVLDRFERALAAEEAQRQEVERRVAELPTSEAYQQCMVQLMMSPDGQRLNEAMMDKAAAYSADPGNAEASAAYQRAQDEYTAAIHERCGTNPDEFEVSELPALLDAAEAAGWEAGGFTDVQYGILKERVTPLCGVADSVGPGELRLPGMGQNIFWVYSALEVESLLPRCSALGPRVKATL